ncbi:transglutaminase domain-containing protein [Lysobacter ciconiae]|uniref:Transglutaminase domain-containing protein n=1 Tax=Novilysobacter ciconiae TaxID=2781022 RepID=A0A7S6ZTT6_9GAMM|nr:transglutaminase domain-containing protein [Lysobacter ciconiae]QOW20654.1 transglutaminase domain-containing protein [Lysobacter ciconiae]
MLAALALCLGMGAAVNAVPLGATAEPDSRAGPHDPDATVAAIVALVDAGHFRQAESAIDLALAARGNSVDAQQPVLFERERMRRILMDFTLEPADVEQQLRRQIPDLRAAEVDAWSQSGLLEHRLIDGRTLYFKRAVSNLFRISPEAAARRAVQTPFRDGPMESANAHHVAIAETALSSGQSSVLPQRIRVTQSLTVNADAVPAGEQVRAWIPFPRQIPGQQEDIRLLQTEPAKAQVAPVSAAQRTVRMEKPARAGAPTEFSVQYEMTVYGRYHQIDGDRVQSTADDPDLAESLAERPPHIVFTPALRAFSRDVVGDETNPYRITQKLFAAVDRIPWAGAREYSTISNISEHALRTGHADCGQQTLLLITLLRLNGIPARWQSGMVYSDSQVGGADRADYWNLHDWGQVYLAPYGWVPMDVTTGRLPGAVDGQGRSLEWFYLGGLDAYRIAFNDDFGTQFQPPKRHFRSDNVDSQRGEVEWSGGNLYFDQWTYDFNAEVLRP